MVIMYESLMSIVCLVVYFGLQTVPFSVCAKIATIHQVTTMLATSKNALFPVYNQLLTTSTDDPSL